MENKEPLFNTKSLLENLNNVLESGIKDLLKDFIDRYTLLEEKHKQILALLTSSSYNLPLPSTSQYNYDEELNYKKNVSVVLTDMTNIISELKQEIRDLKNAQKEQEQKQEEVVNIIPNNEIIEEEHIKLNIEEEQVDLQEKDESDSESEDDADDDNKESEKEEESESESEDESEDEVSEEEEKEVEEVSEEEEKEVEEVSEEEVEEEQKEEKEEEQEEELFEIEIDDVTYCTNDENNGFIYELLEDGDVGEKIGYFKEGEPTFYNEK
jgi:hypothetical protein